MKYRSIAALLLSGACIPALFADSFMTPGIRQAEEIAGQSSFFQRLPVSWKANERDRQNARRAWQIVSEANKNLPDCERKLHVVYITFPGKSVSGDYKARYDRILKNIQAYYSDQMRENGYPPMTFPLDLDSDGKLVIHEVQADVPVSKLTLNISLTTCRNIAEKALAEKGIDFKTNHVLIVCQLEDGTGPYIGVGGVKQGVAVVCDQEGLDPVNLSNNLFFGGRFQQSIGGNASSYMGGIALVLGKSFGAIHTMEGWDYPDSGKSLFGKGNYLYGSELRNEGKGTFLTPVDALYLLCNPLFSGKELFNGLKYISDGLFSNPVVEPVPHGAVIKGNIKSDVPCYAVTVLLDPPGNRTLDSNAVAAIPDENGNFSLEIKRPDYTGYLELTMTALYANGSRKMVRAPGYISEKGLDFPMLLEIVYFSEVINLWSDRKYDEAKAALSKVVEANGSVPLVQKAAPLWEKILTQQEPDLKYAPSEAPAELKEVSLVDCKYLEAKVGWGVPCWDVLLPSYLGRQAYLYDGGAVERFMLMHASGVLKYDLGGKWSRFKAQLGVHWGMDGSVKYEIFGDGKLLHTTAIQYEGKSERVDIPVEGVKQLEIRILDAGNGNGADWSVIGNPVLLR